MDHFITTYSLGGNCLLSTHVANNDPDIDWPGIAFHVLELLEAPKATLHLTAEGTNGLACCTHCAMYQLTIADTHNTLLRLRTAQSGTLKLTAIVEPFIEQGTPIDIHSIRVPFNNCFYSQINHDRFGNPYVNVYTDPHRPNETFALSITELLSAQIKAPPDSPPNDPPMEPLPAHILRKLLRLLSYRKHGFNPCALCLQIAWNEIVMMGCGSCSTLTLPSNDTCDDQYDPHSNPPTCNHVLMPVQCFVQTTYLAHINSI